MLESKSMELTGGGYWQEEIFTHNPLVEAFSSQELYIKNLILVSRTFPYDKVLLIKVVI